METRATGRCLCGAVGFDVVGPLRDVLNCHCHRCRRFSGHHLAATSAADADLRVRDDDGTLTWFVVDGAAYGFCARCGSSLFWRGESSPGRTSICAGVLDPPTGLRTAAAWWVEEASDYHARPDVPEHHRE